MNNFTSFAGFSWISHWLIERRKVSLDYFDNLQYNYLHIVTIEWQGPGKIYAPAEETHTGRGQLPSRTAFFTIGTVEGVANDFERFERSWNGLSLCWTSPLAFVNFFVILDLEWFKDFWVCQKTRGKKTSRLEFSRLWPKIDSALHKIMKETVEPKIQVTRLSVLLSVYWVYTELLMIFFYIA